MAEVLEQLESGALCPFVPEQVTDLYCVTEFPQPVLQDPSDQKYDTLGAGVGVEVDVGGGVGVEVGVGVDVTGAVVLERPMIRSRM